MIGTPVSIREGVTFEQFRNEIVPGNRPVILKGLVSDWPIVRMALEGPDRVVAYLKRLDSGSEIEAMVSPPEGRGEFFYNAELTGFNYRKFRQKLALALDWLLSVRNKRAEAGECEAAVIQALPSERYFPGFMADHPMPLLGSGIEPRFWIGNAARVQTHYDILYNIACNVSGQRTFTLFPPDQLKNLYPGPFDLTPAGTPISMVDIDQPDYAAYPNFREAEAQAQIAILESGDALYVPYFWWHNVRSSGPLNILVNYWWNEARNEGLTPYNAFYAALSALKPLPEDQKAAWRAMFEHFVFGENDDPVAHLPPHAHGILGQHGPEGQQKLKAFVLSGFSGAR